MLFPAAMSLWLVYFGPSASLVESLMIQDGKIVSHKDFLVQSFGFGLAHLMASLHAIFGALSPNRNLVPNVLVRTSCLYILHYFEVIVRFTYDG